MLQSDHISVIANVMVKLILSFLIEINHVATINTDTSKRQAIKLSNGVVLKMGTSNAIVSKNW